MYDYQVICFGDSMLYTDATTVKPINKKCREFIDQFCKDNGIVCLGGVAFGAKLSLSDLTEALFVNGFKENWTMFTDDYSKEVEHLNTTKYDWN